MDVLGSFVRNTVTVIVVSVNVNNIEKAGAEFGSCVKVEVDVLGVPNTVTVIVVSVNVKQH